LGALAPVTALAIGWIGAALGARFEWRYLRRIGRDTWLLAALSAAAAFVAVALGAWLLGRVVPALSAAWTPRLAAVLTLGAVAAASGPGAVILVARAVGLRMRVTRAFSVAAALETACGALAFTVPLALHRPHQLAGRLELGWLAWLVLAAGSGALIGMVFLSLTQRRPEQADVGFPLLATLLFGAGLGDAAELSPFLVCALATALIVNVSPRRHAVRRVLADWERPIYAIFLVIAGALLTLPTVWILVAVPLLAAARAAAKWAVARYGGARVVDTDSRAGGAAMIPTWVAVVTAISLAILALAAIVIAAASVVAALGLRVFLRMLHELAGPAVGDVRGLVATIRTEAEGLAGTSRELRQRIVTAADAAEARLAELDALFEVVQEEVEATVLDVAATMRTVRRGISLLEWGRRTLKRGKKP